MSALNHTPKAEEIASQYPNARRSGSGWKIPCPAHGGEDPNCYIADGDDGSLVAHCHSRGCSWADIMDALGVPKRGQGQWYLASYRNRDGRDRHVYRRNKQIWGKGTQAGCYLLAWGVDAPDKVLVIVEGEKAAKALREFDLNNVTAVSWRGGAKAAVHADCELVKGRKVVLWPDDDDEGRKAMQVVLGKVWDAGAVAVKLVSTDGQTKNDAADYDRATAIEILNSAEPADRPEPVEEEEPPTLWAQVTRSGQPLARSIANAETALLGLPYEFSFNEFTDTECKDGQEISEADLITLHSEIENAFPYSPTKEALNDGLVLACRRKRFHPIRDYLEKCSAAWDGRRRVSSLGALYFSTDNTPLQNAIAALIVRGGAGRIRYPGCHFAYMPIVQSAKQGRGKSMALEILYGEWYGMGVSLSTHDLHRKILESSLGVWCMEFQDMGGWRASDIETVKGLITQSHDYARMAYDRRPTKRLRQYIKVATANPIEILKDSQNRRFPVVRVEGNIDLDALARDRDQIWGEAWADSEKMGKHITLPQALWEEAEEDSRKHRVVSDFEVWVLDWIEESGRPVWFSSQSLQDALPDAVARVTHNMEKARVLNQVGYTRSLKRVDGKVKRGWKKGGVTDL